MRPASSHLLRVFGETPKKSAALEMVSFFEGFFVEREFMLWDLVFGCKNYLHPPTYVGMVVVMVGMFNVHLYLWQNFRAKASIYRDIFF